MESHVLPDNLMLEQIKIRLTEAGVAVTGRSSACVVKKKSIFAAAWELWHFCRKKVAGNGGTPTN
jgi:hypothetical protein